MSSLEFSGHKLAQSTLIVAPRAQWEGVWAEVAKSVHPADVWLGEGWEKPLNVAQLKALHHHASHTPVKQVKLAAVPFADLLSRESANSLLKLLEEPPAYFWTLLLAESEQVLPTIRSRVRLVHAKGGGERVATSREQLANLLSMYDIRRTGARRRASELLYTVPLIHATVQLPVIEEGFRSHP